MRLVVAGVLATAFLAAEALASASNCPCDAYSNHSVLMDFYYATQGPNWSPNNPSNITGWGTSNPVCEWTGLSCQGNLLVMDLLSLELNGTVPYNLWADLGNLGKITFSSHWLSPPDFAGATSLTAIVMWGGSRSTTLPEAWAQVPNLASITVLQTTLRHLPQTWGAMPKLSYLDLANTEPGGYLPDSWSGMTGLQVLDLSGNFMKGTLPASWSAMTQLQYIDLSDNYFTGPIPSLWSSMTQLRQFRMDTNKLTGELPTWLGGNPYLTTVRLGMNSFTGSLPDSWSHATALTTIHLDWNQLTGSLPLSWGRLARLQILGLYENQLTGPLPGTWNSMISLNTLSLAHNQISGPIPATWYSLMHRNFNCAGQSEGCKTFALNNNALTGTPDLCLFAQLNMTFHWFNNNNFTGMPDISCFPNGCASQRVQTVFSGNQFCGECFEPTCNCTELQGQTIAVDHSMAIAEVNSAGDCCLNCQNTPGCVAGVFFSAASVNYCNLKNVSTPLVNKPGYTVLLWP